MIIADRPRKYSKRGQKWSHLCSADLSELDAYAKKHGLKRKDRLPWIHYDVTEKELAELPGVEVMTCRELFAIMKPLRQPRKK